MANILSRAEVNKPLTRGWLNKVRYALQQKTKGMNMLAPNNPRLGEIRRLTKLERYLVGRYYRS